MDCKTGEMCGGLNLKLVSIITTICYSSVKLDLWNDFLSAEAQWHIEY